MIPLQLSIHVSFPNYNRRKKKNRTKRKISLLKKKKNIYSNKTIGHDSSRKSKGIKISRHGMFVSSWKELTARKGGDSSWLIATLCDPEQQFPRRKLARIGRKYPTTDGLWRVWLRGRGRILPRNAEKKRKKNGRRGKEERKETRLQRPSPLEGWRRRWRRRFKVRGIRMNYAFGAACV